MRSPKRSEKSIDVTFVPRVVCLTTTCEIFHSTFLRLSLLSLLRARAPSLCPAIVRSDVQIVNEVMLEDINNILNAGDVPNLYAAEDLDSIISACRSVDTRDDIEHAAYSILSVC